MSKVGSLYFPLRTGLSPTQTAGDKKALTFGKPLQSLPHFHSHCCANITISTSRTFSSFPNETLPIHHLYFSSIFLFITGATSSQMWSITLCPSSIPPVVFSNGCVVIAAVVVFKIIINRQQQQPTFSEHLLCARPSAKGFACLFSLNPHNVQMKWSDSKA